VLDDYEPMPSPTESPSQISQGTVPIAADSEDTLSHERQPTTAGAADAEAVGSHKHSWLWFGVAVSLLAISFLAALAYILS
jgi:hypothetical protein